MLRKEDTLFDLRDPEKVEIGWKKWFAAAKESHIPALVSKKRIDGLIAHVVYPISTDKLEGFTNGYRNHSFFFMLIRFLSISLPNFL